MKPISRAEAQKLGLTRYYTAQPCIHGHVAERFVRNHTCVRCHQIAKRDPTVALLAALRAVSAVRGW